MLSKVIQLSMDGSNANGKFYEHFTGDLDTLFDSALLDMGSCRLYVVHGVSWNGHKLARWKVNVTLQIFYKLFKELTIRKLLLANYFHSNFVLQDGLKT